MRAGYRTCRLSGCRHLRRYEAMQPSHLVGLEEALDRLSDWSGIAGPRHRVLSWKLLVRSVRQAIDDVAALSLGEHWIVRAPKHQRWCDDRGQEVTHIGAHERPGLRPFLVPNGLRPHADPREVDRLRLGARRPSFGPVPVRIALRHVGCSEPDEDLALGVVLGLAEAAIPKALAGGVVLALCHGQTSRVRRRHEASVVESSPAGRRPRGVWGVGRLTGEVSAG